MIQHLFIHFHIILYACVAGTVFAAASAPATTFDQSGQRHIEASVARVPAVLSLDPSHPLDGATQPDMTLVDAVEEPGVRLPVKRDVGPLLLPTEGVRRAHPRQTVDADEALHISATGVISELHHGTAPERGERKKLESVKLNASKLQGNKTTGVSHVAVLADAGVDVQTADTGIAKLKAHQHEHVQTDTGIAKLKAHQHEHVKPQQGETHGAKLEVAQSPYDTQTFTQSPYAQASTTPPQVEQYNPYYTTIPYWYLYGSTTGSPGTTVPATAETEAVPVTEATYDYQKSSESSGNSNDIDINLVLAVGAILIGVGLVVYAVTNTTMTSRMLSAQEALVGEQRQTQGSRGSGRGQMTSEQHSWDRGTKRMPGPLGAESCPNDGWAAPWSSEQSGWTSERQGERQSSKDSRVSGTSGLTAVSGASGALSMRGPEGRMIVESSQASSQSTSTRTRYNLPGLAPAPAEPSRLSHVGRGTNYSAPAADPLASRASSANARTKYQVVQKQATDDEDDGDHKSRPDRSPAPPQGDHKAPDRYGASLSKMPDRARQSHVITHGAPGAGGRISVAPSKRAHQDVGDIAQSVSGGKPKPAMQSFTSRVLKAHVGSDDDGHSHDDDEEAHETPAAGAEADTGAALRTGMGREAAPQTRPPPPHSPNLQTKLPLPGGAKPFSRNHTDAQHPKGGDDAEEVADEGDKMKAKPSAAASSRYQLPAPKAAAGGGGRVTSMGVTPLKSFSQQRQAQQASSTAATEDTPDERDKTVKNRSAQPAPDAQPKVRVTPARTSEDNTAANEQDD